MPNAVRPVFPTRLEKFYFLYTTQTCFTAVLAGSANQSAENQKAGYQAAKLARPDIADVT